jgi:flagellin
MSGFGSSSGSSILERALGKSTETQNNLLKQLSTGKRKLNGAELATLADLETAAALSRGGQRNAQTTNMAMDIASSAVSQLSDIQTRMSELSTQAANGVVSTEQRAALNEEFQALKEEASRIVSTTEFNDQALLDGSSITTQLGDTSLTSNGVDVESQLSSLASLDISTLDGATSAIESLDTFATQLSSSSSIIGSNQTRLLSADSHLASKALEEESAASTIRDADLAEIMALKLANDIKTNSATAIFAQANLQQKKVTELLT